MANGTQKGRGFLDMWQDAMKRQFPAAKAEYWFDNPANAQPPDPQSEQQIWGGEESATTPLVNDHPQRQEQSPLGGEWQTPKAKSDLPDYLQKKLDYLKATGGLFLRDPHSPRAALERGYPLHRAFGWSTDAGNQPGFPNQQAPEPAPEAPDEPFTWPPMSDLLDPWLKELENAAAKQPPPARKPSLRDVHRKMMLQELAGLQAKAAALGVPFDQLPPDPNAPVRSPAIAQVRMRMLKELAEEQAKAASQGASLNQPPDIRNTEIQLVPPLIAGLQGALPNQPPLPPLANVPRPSQRSSPNPLQAPVQPPNIRVTKPAPTPALIASLQSAFPNEPPPPPGIGGQQQQQAKQIASMPETLPSYAQSPSQLGEPVSLPMDPDQIRQQLKSQAVPGKPAQHAGRDIQVKIPEPDEIKDELKSLAQKYGVPEDIVLATAMTENGLNPLKNSSNYGKDAHGNKVVTSTDYGLMQVNSGNIGKTFSGYKIPDDAKTNWKTNAEAGVSILAAAYQRAVSEQFDPKDTEEDHAQQAYSEYNAGFGHRERYLTEDTEKRDLRDSHFLKNYRARRGEAY